MVNKRGAVFILLTLIAILISLYFDSVIVMAFSSIRIKLLSNILLLITSWTFTISIIVILGSLLLWKINKKKLIFPLWISGFASYAVSYILKVVIQRPRPFNMGIVATFPSLAKNSHLIWNYSLPSTHTMFAFATLPFLLKGLPKLRYLWICLAILISLSRVYFGLHFLSDVLIGGLLGYGLGLIILKIEEDKKIWNKIKKFLEKITRPRKNKKN